MPEPFKSYEIGGRKFALHELKLGQEQQLARLFSPLLTGTTPQSVNGAVDWYDKRHELLAIVLTEDGVALKTKNVEEVSAFLQDELTAKQAADMVEDFFGYIPIISLMRNMTAGMKGMSLANAQEETQ